MTVNDALAHFSFTRTEGRDELVAAYDHLITALGRRAEQHQSRGNVELRALALDYAQHAMFDLEQLCRKWEQSDQRGQTY